MTIRRGTTPIVTIKLNEAIAIDTLYITFQQNRQTVLEKTLVDVEVDRNLIHVPFTQSETLLFDAAKRIFMQLRIKSGETVLSSQIIAFSVGDILKDGEI